jgi:hypothetical protein|tara:strand:- start:1652 stop:3094 length:1443 start_codon:yes stop_codon:yes gene_type:complete
MSTETPLVEGLRQKWQPVIEHADLPDIQDSYRKNVTAILLENQEKALREEANVSGVDAVFSDTSGNFNSVSGFNPVLISLVRRSMPNLIAYDVCGVQPMSGPTGLIFAMKAKFTAQGSAEALFNEAPTGFGATVGGAAGATQSGAGFPSFGGTGDPLGNVSRSGSTTGYSAGLGSTSATIDVDPGAPTSFFEGSNTFGEMAFSIDRQSVVAKTRALKAEYTSELAQDLKAVHGLDAETELANILSAEILAEINREVIRSIYRGAKLGCQQRDLTFKSSGATVPIAGDAVNGGGVYDVQLDSDGRWSAEKFRGLMFQIDREANVIAKETRRGKGNFIICTSDVASALAMSGFLNLTPTPNVDLEVDDTGNTFAGTLNGKIKVYIDPYSVSGADYITVGYRGTSPYDAGMFYCPYVPLQMVRAVNETNFQPKIGFKTRYGMVNNPYVSDGSNLSDPLAAAAARQNQYYRIFRVLNLHGNGTP